MDIKPFSIDIPQTVLDDLQYRLAHTRWPDEVEGAGWEYGTNRDYLKSLVDYWQHHFDWRAQETMLNRFAHFRTEIDGVGLHFIHERGQGPNPLPIIMTHGWPDSFFRMYKIIPMLTDPVRYGGSAADSFDVIVPSLPGFGFSDRPRERGVAQKRIAELWGQLMTDGLGYRHFAAAGGDLGRGVTQLLALMRPEQVVGIHLTDVGASIMNTDQMTLSEAEKQYLSAVQQWQGRKAHMRCCTRPSRKPSPTA